MRTLLLGGSVFDGSGAPPERADVAIEGDRIVGLGTGLDGDQAIDATGRTILPGMIDAHVHAVVSGVDTLRLMQEPFSYQFFGAARNLARTLDCGITTVRDAGGADLGVKQATTDGLIDGPELSIAVTVLGQTGGHTDGWMVNGQCMHLLVEHPGRPSGIVDGPEEMRRRVRELIRAGADVIKVCTSGGVLSPRDDPRHPQFRPDELEMCVREAAAAGIGVMAHAQGKPGIINALDAGVRSIEHGIFLDDECIERMLETGTWLVPTLLAPHALLEDIAGGSSLPDAVIAKARLVAAIHKDNVGKAMAAGVRIAMGTDSGVFRHGRNLDELELMREAGLPPAQCLTSATSEAAKLLQLDGEIGRVAPGFRADLTLVGGDPFDFIEYRERITHVLKRGRVVRAATPA
ncbi:MAG: amidohydrolase family protein [Streptosporangiales bacterium]|nr:amidohydrolase family protein [Streptosporangiales bacterium]